MNEHNLLLIGETGEYNEGEWKTEYTGNTIQGKDGGADSVVCTVIV